MADGDDDPELVQLRALNKRIEDLYNARWDDPPPPYIEATIDALEHEAATLIQARTDRTLAPIIARHDAALAEAHRLLGLPPTAGAYQNEPDGEISLAGCGAIGVGGYHSQHYADPDDGVCRWCGDTPPSRATPPRRS